MNLIKKVIKWIVGFWVSSAALVVLYFADIAVIGLALGFQEYIPVIEKAAKTHEFIKYILPAFALFLTSLVFVKLNKKYFHLTLVKIILRYLALMFLLVGSVVLLVFGCSFLWGLIPQDTKDLLINIFGTPFAFLVLFSHGSIFFLFLWAIAAAILLCIIIPLSLIAGFAAASFYEKLPKFLKILVKVAAVVSFVVLVGHLIKVGNTITDDDIFGRTYTTKSDAKFLEKLHKQGFDFNEKKMLPYLVKYGNAPDFILEQVISYGVDVKACSEECFDRISLKKGKFLIEHGADPNVRDTFDGKPFLFEALEDYDTLKSVLEHGADPNIKFETTSTIYGAVDCYKATQNAGMYYFDSRQKNKESYRDIINLLCEYGMDMNYKDEKGLTVLDYANHFGRWLSYKVSMKRTSWEEPYYMIIEKGDKSWSVGIPYLKKPMFLDAVYPRNFAETKDGFTVHFYFFGRDMNYNYSDDFYFKEIDGEPCLYQIEDNFNISTWNEDKNKRDILETETKIKPISPVIKISDLTADRVETLLDAYSRAK